jgi:antitoxin component YwqK of YwqJK toxin-antitoxin module
MMNKLILPIALFFLNTGYSQHDLVESNVYIESAIPVSILLAELHVNSPDIESILNNPVVSKKEKRGKLIQATAYQNNDIKHFDVHFKKQQLHGAWQTFYANEQLCEEGKFVNNLPDGEWRIWYPDGKLKAIVHYSAEKFHYIKADIRRNHPKDKKYAITRHAAMRKNIKPYFKPAFPGTPPDTESLSVLKKIYHNTSGDGSNYIPPFSSCLHHGSYISYFENGLVRDSGLYVNGLKHEVWHETINDNLIAFGYYNHGEKHGQWKYYHSDGSLRYSEHYIHGKLKNSHHFRRDD